MTIAHLSDTHLGFRAYGRVRPDGANVREVDVLETFRAALDAILERKPDLVVHAGDLFHVVRPSNLSLVGGFRAIEAFQSARGGKPMVILGGNHDVPRAGTGGILGLLAGIPGVHVVERETTTLDLGFVRVVAVPSVALRSGMPKLEPPAGPSVLTLHGMSRQALPRGKGEGDFDAEALRHESWTYVALGDYHVFQPYGPNVCYSGSTDFASTNVWEEARSPKGWVWFDEAIGRLQFVPVATRPVLDLPPIDARGLDHEAVESAMLQAAETWPTEPKPIVRQRIVEAAPGLRARIQPAVVRDLSGRALSYNLNVATAVRDAVTPSAAMSLEDSWRAHVAAMRVPAGLSAAEIEAAGLARLREASEDDSRPADA
jgi:DNA repair exonuclease SbcCD nuclease subunit